jgi:hypothetical protein
MICLPQIELILSLGEQSMGYPKGNIERFVTCMRVLDATPCATPNHRADQSDCKRRQHAMGLAGMTERDLKLAPSAF